MSERLHTLPSVLVDREAEERYQHMIAIGQEIFRDSALTESGREITEHALTQIDLFHHDVSPSNSTKPYRLTPQQGKSLEKGDIVDSSSYGNWEAPGGPLEHITLASGAAAFLVHELQTHLKTEQEVSESWIQEAIQQIHATEPLHAAAAAAFHDEGREVTHLFYTNEVIGRRLLQRIGIREDITSVLPDEQVMQVPLDQSMDEYIQQLSAEAIIIRIADEFGKRKGGTNRILQLEDFDPVSQEQWLQNYLQRPHSGRPSDEWGRQHIALNNANTPRYFQGLDTWVRAVSNTTLDDLTHALSENLSPSLSPLPQKSSCKF